MIDLEEIKSEDQVKLVDAPIDSKLFYVCMYFIDLKIRPEW